MSGQKVKCRYSIYKTIKEQNIFRYFNYETTLDTLFLDIAAKTTQTFKLYRLQTHLCLLSDRGDYQRVQRARTELVGAGNAPNQSSTHGTAFSTNH